MTIQSKPVSSGRGEELAKELQQFEQDAQFLALHHHTLLDQYPEQWAAVFDGQVVAHGSNINAVMRELVSKRVPRNRVAISFLTRRKKTLIL